MNNVEKDVVRELEKEMNWKEKIFLKLPIVRKMLIKIYKTGTKDGFNWNNSMFVKYGVPVSAPEEE